MPKKRPDDAVEALFYLISQYPEGIGITELLRLNGKATSRRTLQRWLGSLLENGRIISSGAARAKKYRLAKIVATPRIRFAYQPTPEQLKPENNLVISPEGEQIRVYVNQPLQRRKPVSYQINFLESYQPNHTFYLPETLRAQLHTFGRSPAAQAAAGTFARDILNRLLIDLSWASSHLEGNTYTRLDTQRLIEFGQIARGKDVLETQMILNHKVAIEYLVHEVENVGVKSATLLALHALLSDGLLADSQASGRIRNRAVGIGASVYLPLAVPQRLEELFGIVVEMAGEINDAFEQAFFLMVHLPYLQPFEDVNKRVSRLAANIPLIRFNLCPLSFIDVPQSVYVEAMLGVYELNRIELLRDVFVSAYARSCQQYVAVQQQLIPPDTFRLRYRTQLTQAMKALILSLHSLNEALLAAAIPESVALEDRPRFLDLIQEEFKNLHAGNAVRFGIRPLEFAAWQEAQK